MDEAAIAVLRAAGVDDLHWTVIWDRALRDGFIDAFSQAGERDAFMRALIELAKTGVVEKTSKGTYRLAGARPA